MVFATWKEGRRGLAFALGMAAITAVFCFFSSGDHILVSRDVYGGTFRLAHRLLPRFGFQVDFIDTTEVDCIRLETRALKYLPQKYETIT